MYVSIPLIGLMFTLILVIPSSVLGNIPLCLRSRLDVHPCSNSKITHPSSNEFGIYQTRFRRDGGRVICRIRKRDEIIRSVDTEGVGNVRLIYSPGYELQPRINYLNQMLVDYNIKCADNEIAFFTLLSLELEDRNCNDPSTNKLRCQDYVLIDRGPLGVQEFCGTNMTSTSFFVGTGKFHVKFRTSTTVRQSGFQAYVVCSRITHQSSIGKRCTQVSPTSRLGHEQKIVLSTDRMELSEDTSLTPSEIMVANTLIKPLFDVAYAEARQKGYIWPPPNVEDDDIDLADEIRVSDERDLIDRFDDIIIRKPVPEPIPNPPHLDRVKRLQNLNLQLKEAFDNNRAATRMAVSFEDACNPVLRSITQSYINVAKRVNPTQLNSVRAEIQEREQELQK